MRLFCRLVIQPIKKHRSLESGAFYLGVDRLQYGTRNRDMQSIDRPHDPGDAADLSIMGYLVFVKIAQSLKKINRILATDQASSNVG